MEFPVEYWMAMQWHVRHVGLFQTCIKFLIRGIPACKNEIPVNGVHTSGVYGKYTKLSVGSI